MQYSRTFASFTHGNIPLSMNAKNLMQNLRIAIGGAIGVGQYSAHNHAVARSRGELATYMSGLEDTNEAARLTMLTMHDELCELRAAAYGHKRSAQRQSFAYGGCSETRTWSGGPGGLQNIPKDVAPYAMPISMKPKLECWPTYTQSRIQGMFYTGRVNPGPG
jgi:hypothetical protein